MFWVPAFAGMTILSHAGGGGTLERAGGGQEWQTYLDHELSAPLHKNKDPLKARALRGLCLQIMLLSQRLFGVPLLNR